MFTTDAILLKKIPIRDGDELHELFTKEFGKIRVWVKRKKQIAEADHGSILHCIISTKASKNTLESSHIKQVIRTEGLDYLSILCPLLCLQTVSLLCPSGLTSVQVFLDYSNLLPHFADRVTSEKAKELFVMKLIKNSGMGWKRNESEESIVFRKIYKSIEEYSLSAFVKLKELDGRVLDEIRSVNQICMSQYIS